MGASASRQLRRSSPLSLRSILMTSAPKSARKSDSILPATRRDRSRTRISFSGPSMAGLKVFTAASSMKADDRLDFLVVLHALHGGVHLVEAIAAGDHALERELML